MKTTIRVLIVDDEPNLRFSLRALLEDEGFDVSVAADSAEATALLEAGDVDVAIVDLHLPRIGGDRFIRDVHDRWPATTYIINTGSLEYEIPADLRRLPRLSATVLRKPGTSIEFLSEEIRRLTGAEE